MVNSIFVRLERILSRFEVSAQRMGVLWTALSVGTASWTLSWFMFFSPGLIHGQRDRYHDVTAQCANLFERHLNEPIMAYRLTVPAIAGLLRLGGPGALIIQYLAIISSLSCIYVAVTKRAGSSSVGLLSALIVSMTFVAQWSNNYLGFTDSVSHFCAALCLLFPFPWVMTVLTIVGTMNDERFVLSIPFLLMWHANLSGIREMITGGWRLGLGFAVGLCVVCALRLGLTAGWIGPGVQIPPLYAQIRRDVIEHFHPWDSSWAKFILNVSMAFRWAWFFPFWFLLARPNRRLVGVTALILFGTCIAVGTLSAMMVADVSKSVAYLYPAVLLGIWGVVRVNFLQARRGLLVVAVLMLLSPTFFHIGYWSQRLRPMPFELVQIYLRSR